MMRAVAQVGEITVDNDGVAMTGVRQMRLRHVSDTPPGGDECFGGDTMGHWNVGRINRILDAMNAPVVRIPIAIGTMRAMAAVGKPDYRRVGRYKSMGLKLMPPLTFVAVGGEPGNVSTMMVDGHHRMLAMTLMTVPPAGVPVRILPHELVDDVRIVELGECVVFPPYRLPKNEVELGGWRP